MSKAKELFLKCLPMLIVLVSTGIFALLIKLAIGIFYAPKDTVYDKEYGEDGFTVVQCYQNPSSYYYVYGEDFSYDEEKYDNVAGEHNNAHLRAEPIAYFVLNEPALNMDNTTVKYIMQGNGLTAVQFGEFVLYRLEGQYGVFAPLRDYKESTTSRKNDLYVVRQLLKNDYYKGFDLPEWESEEEFVGQLEKIEWNLDNEYGEDG
ncbi:MAG: hypothetical protein K2G32_03295 [Oscillospiraceae bacterium]|nr:hypothetical protein [Oscillospiraceae bacterium]